jgi:orotate phosphoribosyltransferase
MSLFKTEEELDVFFSKLAAMKEILFGNENGDDFDLRTCWSPIYLSLRGLARDSVILNKVADCYIAALEPWRGRFDYLVGVPEAGTQLAAVVGSRGGFPVLPLRAKLKEYGAGGGLVMCDYRRGATVCLLDNTITSGESFRDCANLLASADIDLLPKFAVSYADREEGGSQFLRSLGFEFTSSTTLKRMVEGIHRQSGVPERMYARVMFYLADPKTYQLRYHKDKPRKYSSF